MANVASVDVEINSTTVINDEPKSVDDEISLKNPESNVDQNDSRQTDPEGAQSPASSTYADCEDQNEISNSENHVECQNKETCNEINETQITLSKDNNVDSNENISLSKTEEPVSVNVETIDECEINNNSKCDDDKSDPKLECDGNVDSNEKTCDTGNTENIAESSTFIPNDKSRGNSENEQEIFVDEEDLGDEHYDEEDDKSRSEGEYSEEGSDHEEDRENGDGEEENEEEDAAAEKPLDDDEDRRNPQYIPKRGFFYEHDDRTVNTSEDETSEGAKKEAEVKELESAKGKGKRLIPDGKWQHDMYREDEQKPKSSQELIDIYGYDIRNEEAAPKARRRRKYGRGPNKYTRKWDDEGAYNKQLPSKPFRPRNKTSFKKEDYEQEFPAIDDKKAQPEIRTRERIPPKRTYHSEQFRNDDVPVRDRDDFKVANQKSNSIHQERPERPERLERPERPERPDRPERSRNFSKRIPNVKEHRSPYNADSYDPEFKNIQKTVRNPQFTPSGENMIRGRGRGVGHGKNIRVVNNFEEGPRLQFTPGNRGRAKRLPKQSQHYYPSRQITDDNIQELSDQMADLATRRKIISDKQQYGGESENPASNEQPDVARSSLNAVSNVRSKRYSHQRQRLLPEVNKNAATNALNLHQSIQQNMQPITHTVQSVQNVAASGLCQSMAPTHTSMPLMTQNQCSPTPQTVAAPLSVTPASIPSSSLAVSASLIPLSAPPLTASGPALSAGAPPLPIMGFFQHPQAGYTNQAAPAQLYTRDQTVMGAASNQPVQLVAFLPASPILSNTNHSQSAPPPPPPPPPPGFPTTVMSYQQNSPSPQNAASFNSETYNMPPVTLAPIHQPPEMYQSRGGVTYYNTRSQVKPRSPPPPRVKTAIPIVPPPSSEPFK